MINVKAISIFMLLTSFVTSNALAQDTVRWSNKEISAHYDTIPYGLRLSNNHKFIKKTYGANGENEEKLLEVRYKFTDTCGGVEFIWIDDGKKVLKGYYKGDCKIYCDTGLQVNTLTGEERAVQYYFYRPVRCGKWKKY